MRNIIIFNILLTRVWIGGGAVQVYRCCASLQRCAVQVCSRVLCKSTAVCCASLRGVLCKCVAVCCASLPVCCASLQRCAVQVCSGVLCTSAGVLCTSAGVLCTSTGVLCTSAGVLCTSAGGAVQICRWGCASLPVCCARLPVCNVRIMKIKVGSSKPELLPSKWYTWSEDRVELSAIPSIYNSDTEILLHTNVI